MILTTRDAAASKRGIAIAARDAAAERDATVTAKDAATSGMEAVNAQHETSHRAVLDMTSPKDSPATCQVSLI